MQIKNRQNLLNDLAGLIEEIQNSTDQPYSKDSVHQALQHILDSQHPPAPETKKVGILLSDLRGFTAMAEKYSAMDIIKLLDHYFNKMTQIIAKYGGTVDKFMGDSILAYFDSPNNPDSFLQNTLSCAIEMQLAMTEVNLTNQAQGMENLYMGIGINTGEVVAGTIGSESYREYTVIGDQVNLAFRVESFSLRGQILISENTYEQVKDHIEIGDINDVSVKGKSLPVKLYELLAIKGSERLQLPIRDGRKGPRVDARIPLSFYRLLGKQIIPELLVGHISNISYGGIFITTTQELYVFSDIKLQVSLSLMDTHTSEVYAKVLRSEKTEQGYLSALEFTIIDDDAKNTIKTYVDSLI